MGLLVTRSNLIFVDEIRLSQQRDSAFLGNDVLGAGATVADDPCIGALRALDTVGSSAVPFEMEVFGSVDKASIAVVDEHGEHLLLVGGEDTEGVVVGPLGVEHVGSVESELGDW